MALAIQAIVALLFPAVSLFLCRKFKILEKLTPVSLCYAFGMIYSNLLMGPVDQGGSGQMMGAIVVFALCMMLLSSDLKLAVLYAPKVALTTCLFFVMVTLSAVFMIKVYPIDHAPLLAGMFTGSFVGSMPNLAAVGQALHSPSEVFILAQVADVVICGVYFLLLITCLIRLLGAILKRDTLTPHDEEDELVHAHNFSYKGMFSGLGISAVVVGASVGLASIFPKSHEQLIIILLVSLSATGLSFVKKIRELPSTYITGEYLFLSFCTLVGTITKLSKVVEGDGSIFIFTGGILLIALTAHFILCYLLKIDRDTTIISSTAGIFSPAMIGPIVTILGNKNILVPGIGAGLIGLSLGTVLGLFVHWIGNL